MPLLLLRLALCASPLLLLPAAAARPAADAVKLHKLLHGAPDTWSPTESAGLLRTAGFPESVCEAAEREGVTGDLLAAWEDLDALHITTPADKTRFHLLLRELQTQQQHDERPAAPPVGGTPAGVDRVVIVDRQPPPQPPQPPTAEKYSPAMLLLTVVCFLLGALCALMTAQVPQLALMILLAWGAVWGVIVWLCGGFMYTVQTAGLESAGHSMIDTIIVTVYFTLGGLYWWMLGTLKNYADAANAAAQQQRDFMARWG
jgi:hypothetical protein